jgi:hypothetical protein
MNERFVHKPGCGQREVGKPSLDCLPFDGPCLCWCHPTKPLHGTIGHPPHTGEARGPECPECREEGWFGPVTVITAEGTTTGYLTADDRIVVDPAVVGRSANFEKGWRERAEARTLLEAAGYKVTVSDVVFGASQDGEWDLFIEDPDKPGNDPARRFSDLDEVRAFIDGRAQA